MPKRMLIEMPDGTVSIVVPAEQARQPGESDEAFYPRIFARTIASVPRYQGRQTLTVDEADLPADRTDYHHRWKIRGGKVIVEPLA